MFLKFEKDDKFTVVQLDSEQPMESANAIIFNYRQFLSNCTSDDLNCGKVAIARGARTQFEEISSEEFRRFIQGKIEVLQKLFDKDPDGGFMVYNGKLTPMFLLKVK